MTADIMHFHGLWMMPNVYPGWAVKDTDCSLVFSPRGMLDEWALNWSKGRKSVFWNTMQRRVIERVDCFHATSDMEAEAIRNAGFTAPIAVIPIGIDIPSTATRSANSGTRVLLYLGRLHPKKNVEALLHSWAQLQGAHADWSLSIVGEGDASYVAGLKLLSATLGTERVDFHGPAYGDDKLTIYAHADLYVLPTFSENFGISVAEALSNSIPVVTTRGAPWSGLIENHAGWWTDTDDSSIATALDDAMSHDRRELHAMGRNGQEWMRREFRWSEVASQMVRTYRWLRGECDPPACVQRD